LIEQANNFGADRFASTTLLVAAPTVFASMIILLVPESQSSTPPGTRPGTGEL